MPQFRLGTPRPALANIDQDPRNGQLHGHELVRQMARTELVTEEADGNSTPQDSRAALASWRQAYRELGVVLAPAVQGLGGLDTFVYRPLRDAAFLTARN